MRWVRHPIIKTQPDWRVLAILGEASTLPLITSLPQTSFLAPWVLRSQASSCLLLFVLLSGTFLSLPQWVIFVLLERELYSELWSHVPILTVSQSTTLCPFLPMETLPSAHFCIWKISLTPTTTCLLLGLSFPH